jgi:hypothetical protein
MSDVDATPLNLAAAVRTIRWALYINGLLDLDFSEPCETTDVLYNSALTELRSINCQRKATR